MSKRAFVANAMGMLTWSFVGNSIMTIYNWTTWVLMTITDYHINGSCILFVSWLAGYHDADESNTIMSYICYKE